jgi:hypothetical protein
MSFLSAVSSFPFSHSQDPNAGIRKRPINSNYGALIQFHALHYLNAIGQMTEEPVQRLVAAIPAFDARRDGVTLDAAALAADYGRSRACGDALVKSRSRPQGHRRSFPATGPYGCCRRPRRLYPASVWCHARRGANLPRRRLSWRPGRSRWPAGRRRDRRRSIRSAHSPASSRGAQ